MADQKQQFKRAPALYRAIADVQPDDIRVRLLGRVIGSADGTLVIDDGTGRADVICEDFTASTNDIVRIFCRVLPLEKGFELRSELVQKMDGLDTGLYQKTLLGRAL